MLANNLRNPLVIQIKVKTIYPLNLIPNSFNCFSSNGDGASIIVSRPLLFFGKAVIYSCSIIKVVVNSTRLLRVNISTISVKFESKRDIKALL